jgi:hypothetical protein
VPNVYAFRNPRSAPLPHRTRARIQTLERDRGLDSRLLADALLDVEVALLNGEGHLFRRFHLKYEKEQNGSSSSP